MSYIHINIDRSADDDKPIAHKVEQTKGGEILAVMMDRLAHNFSNEEIVDLLFCMMLMHQYGDDIEEDYMEFLKEFTD